MAATLPRTVTAEGAVPLILVAVTCEFVLTLEPTALPAAGTARFDDAGITRGLLGEAGKPDDIRGLTKRAAEAIDGAGFFRSGTDRAGLSVGVLATFNVAGSGRAVVVGWRTPGLLLGGEGPVAVRPKATDFIVAADGRRLLTDGAIELAVAVVAVDVNLDRGFVVSIGALVAAVTRGVTRTGGDLAVPFGPALTVVAEAGAAAAVGIGSGLSAPGRRAAIVDA
jgi:hypothetical protein